MAETGPTVAVVITTYNHAHFLDEAIQSVLAQVQPAAEILVVDDGSTDEPARITHPYTEVRLLRQPNQGLAAARNTGLRLVTADYVLFLDADDRLLPTAIAAGLACFERARDCAFVYGAHRRIGRTGVPLGPPRYDPVGPDAYCDLLGGNLIAMHASVLYDRARLLDLGGFDASLRRCEDYELYLRLARHGRIASHPRPVAEYRQHDTNMSHDHRAMLNSVLDVHARHQAAAAERPATLAAWRGGRRNWINYYMNEALAAARARPDRSGLRVFAAAARLSPYRAVQRLAAAGWRHVCGALSG